MTGSFTCRKCQKLEEYRQLNAVFPTYDSMNSHSGGGNTTEPLVTSVNVSALAEHDSNVFTTELEISRVAFR